MSFKPQPQKPNSKRWKLLFNNFFCHFICNRVWSVCHRGKFWSISKAFHMELGNICWWFDVFRLRHFCQRQQKNRNNLKVQIYNYNQFIIKWKSYNKTTQNEKIRNSMIEDLYFYTEAIYSTPPLSERKFSWIGRFLLEIWLKSFSNKSFHNFGDRKTFIPPCNIWRRLEDG